MRYSVQSGGKGKGLDSGQNKLERFGSAEFLALHFFTIEPTGEALPARPGAAAQFHSSSSIESLATPVGPFLRPGLVLS